MKQIIKNLLRRTPYRIVRASAKNRFVAIDETLAGLKGRGYSPGMVVDGGANVGEFALLSRSLFPAATVHMIEPQPACLR